MLTWFNQLVTGPGGLPDEGAVGYLLAQLAGLGGVVYQTIHTGVFPFVDYATYEVALIPLYTALTTVREWVATKAIKQG